MVKEGCLEEGRILLLMVGFQLDWVCGVSYQTDAFGEVEFIYGGIKLHIDYVLSWSQSKPDVSILLVVIKHSIQELIVFMCLRGLVLKEHESGATPPLLNILQSFLLRLHIVLVDEERVVAFLGDIEVVDYPIAGCK